MGNWFTSEHCPTVKFSQSLYSSYCLNVMIYKGSRWISGEKTGIRGHFVDETRSGINNWLPYSQSPRPYAICRVSVHSITLRIFRTIQSFIISRQLLLWYFQYYFLLFLFRRVTQWMRIVKANSYTVCALIRNEFLEEVDMLPFHLKKKKFYIYTWQAHF